jgi:hypothetical protein
LGQHCAGGVVHTGQQVYRTAVAVAVAGGCWCAGASQALAVDGDRPPPSLLLVAPVVSVAKPGSDRSGQRLGVQPAERAADGGLGRDQEAPGEGVAAGADRCPDRLGRIRGPLGDRGKRPRPCQHRGRRQRQDGDQWVAAPGAGPGIGDGRQVGEQVRSFGFLQRIGGSKRGQPRRDPDRG